MLPFQATGNTMELVLIKESIWAYISIVTSQEKVSRTSSVFEYIPYPYSTSIDKTEAKTCDVGRATERQNFFFTAMAREGSKTEHFKRGRHP
jgi:hypothetical protein